MEYNKKRLLPTHMLTKDYAKQINKVIDYIHAHTDRQLSVAELCSMVDLSSYHFHRIFTTTVGESLAKYVMRKRLEKSANLLLSDSNAPIMNIAFECGFNSVNVFCRNFKRHFGETAEAYRRKKEEENSKNRPFNSRKDTENRLYSRYFCTRKTIIIGDKTMNCTFEIKKVTPFNMIYCRHTGAFDAMEMAFTRLMQWAYPRGLIMFPETKLLSVYHDNPDITAKEKLISDAGMIVKEKIKTDGEVGQYEIEGGLYAVGRFELAMEDFPDAWHTMFQLVEEHGCQCSNAYHFEIYQNNRDEHPEKKWIVDIHIPVKVN